MIEAAVEAGDGKWAIGVDSDQYFTSSEEVREYILTSMLKRVDTAVYSTIEKYIAGNETLGGVTVLDLAADGVGYSTSGGFVDDITDQLDELLHPSLDPAAEKKLTPVAKGLPAGPGGGVGESQRALRVYGITESGLMDLMEELVAAWPDAKLFSLPRLGEEFQIELGFRGTGDLDAPFAALVAGLESRKVRFVESTD